MYVETFKIAINGHNMFEFTLIDNFSIMVIPVILEISLCEINAKLYRLSINYFYVLYYKKKYKVLKRIADCKSQSKKKIYKSKCFFIGYRIAIPVFNLMHDYFQVKITTVPECKH